MFLSNNTESKISIYKTLEKMWGNQILKKHNLFILNFQHKLTCFRTFSQYLEYCTWKKFKLTAAHMKSVQYRSCSFCFPIVLRLGKFICFQKRLLAKTCKTKFQDIYFSQSSNISSIASSTIGSVEAQLAGMADLIFARYDREQPSQYCCKSPFN